MGLFSSKYVTSVATIANRVIDDENLPNSIKNGAMKSLIEGSDQLIEYAMEELVQCIGIKCNQMYNYGRDHYMHGLPSSSIETSLSGQDLVKNTIQEDVGPITIDYYHYGMLNTLHVGWVKLMAMYGYNQTTNMLTVDGQAAYLVDMVVVVKEASLTEMANGALDQWGTPPTAGITPARIAFPDLAEHSPWEADANAASDYLRVTYTWQNTVTLLMETRTIVIPITGFDETASFHQVKYKKADGSFGYWIYKAGDGAHPAIDKLHTPAWNTGGSFFPWAYFRYAKTNIAADHGTAEYKQMSTMLNFLSMGFDSVADAIDENPDIKDVENAMLMMAVPAVTTNQMELRYLFDFFEGLYQETGGELKPSLQASGAMGLLAHFVDSSSEDASIVIQDKKFKMSLGFRHIFKTRVAGTIGNGKIGTLECLNGKDILIETGANGAQFATPVTFHTYRRQLNVGTYEEIRVINLKMKYFVFEDYFQTADENDDILLIPLDKSITEHYSVPDREELYARSLHYIFNCRVITEVKWYQQGWFRALMVIVAIVITIWSWGKTYQLVVAALASGATLTAVAVIIVMKIIEQLLIALIIKLFIKLVGIKLAFLVAIVAVMYGGYKAIEAGSLKGAPWATELLQVGSGLAKGISSELKDDFDALKKESEEFNDMIKTKQEKLEAAEDLLSYNNYLAPMVIFGETPAEYYDRTVHSGNIGVIGIDAITSYVDMALTLPKLSQTIGENEL